MRKLRGLICYECFNFGVAHHGIKKREGFSISKHCNCNWAWSHWEFPHPWMHFSNLQKSSFHSALGFWICKVQQKKNEGIIQMYTQKTSSISIQLNWIAIKVWCSKKTWVKKSCWRPNVFWPIRELKSIKSQLHFAV